jgi:hypothetical protein
MRNDENDLSFAGFSSAKTAPTFNGELSEDANYAETLARREGSVGELCSPCASPAKLAREEESQPEEDQ